MTGKLMFNSNQNRKENTARRRSTGRASIRPQSFGGVRQRITGDRSWGRGCEGNKILSCALANATDGKLHLCSSEADFPALGRMIVQPIRLSMDESMGDLRHLTKQYAAKENIPMERQQDLETAVGEAATNAVVHGGGGTGSVFAVPGQKIQVCIHDNGSGIIEENLPKAMLIRGFSTKDTLGHGMKMILQAVDRVYLLTGVHGTTIILEQDVRHKKVA
jgi:anti-sigma regulatory factor (Ser/Thr protein kinase)